MQSARAQAEDHGQRPYKAHADVECTHMQSRQAHGSTHPCKASKHTRTKTARSCRAPHAHAEQQGGRPCEAQEAMQSASAHAQRARPCRAKAPMRGASSHAQRPRTQSAHVHAEHQRRRPCRAANAQAFRAYADGACYTERIRPCRAHMPMQSAHAHAKPTRPCRARAHSMAVRAHM